MYSGDRIIQFGVPQRELDQVHPSLWKERGSRCGLTQGDLVSRKGNRKPGGEKCQTRLVRFALSQSPFPWGSPFGRAIGVALLGLLVCFAFWCTCTTTAIQSPNLKSDLALGFGGHGIPISLKASNLSKGLDCMIENFSWEKYSFTIMDMVHTWG